MRELVKQPTPAPSRGPAPRRATPAVEVPGRARGAGGPEGEGGARPVEAPARGRGVERPRTKGDA